MYCIANCSLHIVGCCRTLYAIDLVSNIAAFIDMFLLPIRLLLEERFENAFSIYSEHSAAVRNRVDFVGEAVDEAFRQLGNEITGAYSKRSGYSDIKTLPFSSIILCKCIFSKTRATESSETARRVRSLFAFNLRRLLKVFAKDAQLAELVWWANGDYFFALADDSAAPPLPVCLCGNMRVSSLPARRASGATSDFGQSSISSRNASSQCPARFHSFVTSSFFATPNGPNTSCSLRCIETLKRCVVRKRLRDCLPSLELRVAKSQYAYVSISLTKKRQIKRQNQTIIAKMEARLQSLEHIIHRIGGAASVDEVKAHASARSTHSSVMPNPSAPPSAASSTYQSWPYGCEWCKKRFKKILSHARHVNKCKKRPMPS